MTRARERAGFSLTELLLTLAIVGVLASMLLPVFARVRQTARESECLSHVQAIAQAITMYQHDWSALFPREESKEAEDYFDHRPGGLSPRTAGGHCLHLLQANPYQRPAVLLDKYLKNRAVWDCPQAKQHVRVSFVVPAEPKADWVQTYRSHEGKWGRRSAQCGGGPCCTAWPAGWGGALTDSFAQSRVAAGEGPGRGWPAKAGSGFQEALAVNHSLRGLNLSSVRDPARYVACGDDSRQVEIDRIESVAFPDTCRLNGMESGAKEDGLVCPPTDWENCTWTQECGVSGEARRRVMNDDVYRKTFTRHDGGSNVGFLDGHAKWYLADWLLINAQPFRNARLEGICSCWPGVGRGSVGRGPRKPAIRAVHGGK